MQWLNDLINKHAPDVPVEQTQPKDNTGDVSKYISNDMLIPGQWTPKPSKGVVGGVGGHTVDSVFPLLISAESRGKHMDDKGGLTTSPVGAKGITQVMPKSGKDPGYGVAPLKDDSEAEYLRFGKELLTAYTKEFGGDVAKGLAAYNWGPGALKRSIERNGDKWRDKLPSETSNHLDKILGDKRKTK